MTEASLVFLPGDGIGPEVVAGGGAVLDAVARRFGHSFATSEYVIGGAAIDAEGTPLPAATLAACRESDAVLLGAVGGPAWDDAPVRPEAGLLTLRRSLGLFANLRPVAVSSHLTGASPLRPEIIAGVDIMFVRELTGGIYFGDSGIAEDGAYEWNKMRYSTGEIERIVRVAADLAGCRSGRVTSVDKANVLEVSRLWRTVTARVMAEEYPDLDLELQLVDAMAMHLLARPHDFDVVVTANLFGDILTDEAAMLSGSLGLLPSASLGDSGLGLYEPVHGSAPDIAGNDIANPLGAVLASAMALRHSLDLTEEAAAVEAAVDEVLAAGLRTADIAGDGTVVGTRAMTEAVVAAIGG